MFNNLNLKPMLLKEIDTPFTDPKYLYEIKFDGIRALIHVSNKSIKVISRNNVDMTKIYPELKSIQNIVGNKKVIFDGEIIALDNAKPSFQKLQMRSRLKNITNKIIEDIPVYFICFDILYENKSLIDIPLIKRKDILNKYHDTDIFIKTKYYQDGKTLFKKIKKLNLEGIVAKEKDSLYIPSKRVDNWLKIKNIKDSEFIIHGYLFKKEKYTLYLGEYKNNNLYYVGSVSITSKNPLMTKVLKTKKVSNQFINFNDEGTFIKPTIEVTVTYLERTKDNKLRHPALK